MKKIINSLLALPLIFGAVSCSDYLNVEPSDRITADNLLSTDAGINAYMAGKYYDLPIEDYRYYPNGSQYHENRCNGGITNMIMTVEAVHPEWGSHIGETGSFGGWETLYRYIRQYNELQDNIARMKPSNPETLDRIRGEYHFMMAYTYFALARRYGGVSIIKSSQEYTGDIEALKVPRSTEVDTWKFIMEQFDEAIKYLPETTEKERVNRWTAYGMKSRAALHAASVGKFWDKAPLTGEAVDKKLVGGFTAADVEFFYQQAIDAAAAVIKGARYELANANPSSLDGIAENFGKLLTEGYNSPEVMLVRRYSFPGTCHNMGRWHEPNQLSSEFASRCCPTLNMIENFAKIDPVTRAGEYNVKFETTVDGNEDYVCTDRFDGSRNYKRYNGPSDIYANRDPRMYATVILPGEEWGGQKIIVQGGLVKPDGSAFWKSNDSYEYNGTTYYSKGADNEAKYSGWVNMRANGTTTGLLLKKYLKGRDDQVWDQITTPFTELRYAEVLLNYAEAVVESGLPGAPGCISAQDAFNQIRRRAGFLDSKPMTAENVRLERMAEFALEYNATWDYWRRREYHEYYNGSNYRTAMVPMLDLTTGVPQYIFVRANGEAGNSSPKRFENFAYYRAIPGIESNSLVQNPNY